MAQAQTVDEFRQGLDAPARAAVDKLREIVLRSHDGLTETIKWNAPSFAHAGRDRVTLGLNPRGGYRMVLHRGAKASDSSGFAFDDGAKLAEWPARDRGVVNFRDEADIDAKSEAVAQLVCRWIRATA